MIHGAPNLQEQLNNLSQQLPVGLPSKQEIALQLPQWKNHPITRKLLALLKARLKAKTIEIGASALTPSKTSETVRLQGAEIHYIIQLIDLIENDENLLNS